MKILFCPAHYALLDDRGSELEWAYKITNSIASLYTDSVAVTGFSNVKKPHYKIVCLQKGHTAINLGILNTIRFAILYGIEGIRQLRTNHFDIHHHILPFYIGRTFNLAFLIPMKNKPIRVIGPVQNPLPFFADNLDDQHQKLVFSKQITNILSKLFIDIISVVLLKLSYATLRRANSIIVVDASLKTILVRHGIKESRICVIPPGVDVNTFALHTKAKPSTVSRKHLNIISTGALIKRKGFDILINSVAEVIRIDKTISFHVNIYGEGPQRNALESQVTSMGLSQYITFHGFINHKKLPSKYAQADLFVSMTKAESYAQMYLEAISSGLPIISTMNPGSKTLIRNGFNGYLVKDDSYKDLARHIARLAGNTKLLNSMKKRSQIESKKYDWKSSIIPQYLSIYEKLIQLRMHTNN